MMAILTGVRFQTSEIIIKTYCRTVSRADLTEFKSKKGENSLMVL
jgi:hypothetical protein